MPLEFARSFSRPIICFITKGAFPSTASRSLEVPLAGAVLSFPRPPLAGRPVVGRSGRSGRSAAGRSGRYGRSSSDITGDDIAKVRKTEPIIL